MLPVLFQVGPLTLYSYGAMLVVAFLLALWMARKRAPRFGLTAENVMDAGFWALIPGILGARAVFLMTNPPKNPAEIWSLQFAGLTSFGGVIFGALGLCLWANRAKKPIFSILDTVGPAFLLAHPIGRIGCLLNGCCYGRVCTEWYCVSAHAGGLRHEPAQVYDALMNLGVLLVLLWLERRGSFRKGQAFALTIFFHGLTRIIYEFWRAGTEEQYQQGIATGAYLPGLPITEAQLAAGAMSLLALVLFFVLNSRSAKVSEAIS